MIQFYTYKRKLLGILLIVLILLSTSLSYGYIIKEMNHDCTGKDCTVCSTLESVIQYMTNIICEPRLIHSFLIIAVMQKINHMIEADILYKITLITLKVELRD